MGTLNSTCTAPEFVLFPCYIYVAETICVPHTHTHSTHTRVQPHLGAQDVRDAHGGVVNRHAEVIHGHAGWQGLGTVATRVHFI